MSIWKIIVTILVVINALAFLSAMYVSYDSWRTKKAIDWRPPLMGFFFIPLCVLIVLALPFSMYRKYKKRNKIEKRKEENKRYHLQQFCIRLKGLPFKPSSQEIIYIENDYNKRINQIIMGNLNYIQECLDGSMYFQSFFVYLPNLVQKLSCEESAIGYVAPYIKEKSLSTNFALKSNSLLDYMANPDNKSEIGPCFARYCGEQSGYSFFECIGFDPDEGIDEKNFLRFLGKKVHYFFAFNTQFVSAPPMGGVTGGLWEVRRGV